MFGRLAKQDATSKCETFLWSFKVPRLQNVEFQRPLVVPLFHNRPLHHLEPQFLLHQVHYVYKANILNSIHVEIKTSAHRPIRVLPVHGPI